MGSGEVVQALVLDLAQGLDPGLVQSQVQARTLPQGRTQGQDHQMVAQKLVLPLDPMPVLGLGRAPEIKGMNKLFPYIWM
jgi:hypothetical protein